MNPYVAVTLVMCGVIFLALAATAYMAVYFTRKAKADLQHALTPLAAVLDGKADVENAQVEGRYAGKLAFGRMAHAEGGPVRVFQTELIDAAAGEKWLYVAYPARGTTEFQPEGSPMFQELEVLQRTELAAALVVTSDWFQLDYSPEGGYVRLTTPMSTRKDIPPEDDFRRQLALLDKLSDENRAMQERNAAKAGVGK
ncbi:MAG: hypothetical protein M3457_22050 [Chloroflexota bacterium]|nr:hypothetical protein [Chloroflexota bacterium]